MPRWLALISSSAVWIVGVPLVHAGLPWLLARVGPRYGWADGAPALANLLGLVPIAAGATLLVWVMPLHLARTPERVKLEWTPSYLLERGPYAFTRNPMYVGEVLLWLGQALLYGRVAVLGVGLLLFSAMHWQVIPREERALEERFGEPYRAYLRRVPRWLGRPRGGATAR
jgi:protein-S-isoprenylcysteine O-methyltransferase Ste14